MFSMIFTVCRRWHRLCILKGMKHYLSSHDTELMLKGREQSRIETFERLGFSPNYLAVNRTYGPDRWYYNVICKVCGKKYIKNQHICQWKHSSKHA
jgi:hypothetical protein